MNLPTRPLKPRSGDAFVAPSRPSGGETKIDRREIFVCRCEGGMGLNVMPANVGVEDVGQRNRNSKSIEKKRGKNTFLPQKNWNFGVKLHNTLTINAFAS